MKARCIDKEFDLTVGKDYKIISVESQGEFYCLINDSGLEKKYNSSSFLIIEADKAKCIYAANMDLTLGKIYDVVSIDEKRKECRIIDDSGEDYIYSMKAFLFL